MPYSVETRKEKTREYYIKNREKILAKAKEKGKTPEAKEKSKLRNKKRYESLSKEEKLERARLWNQSDAGKKYKKEYYKRPEVIERNRDWYLGRLYGIDSKDFDKMLKDQSGLCLICREPSNLRVDHNHDTGKVRGLLCDSCNLGLGKFKDNAEILKSAFQYLLKDGSL